MIDRYRERDKQLSDSLTPSNAYDHNLAVDTDLLSYMQCSHPMGNCVSIIWSDMIVPSLVVVPEPMGGSRYGYIHPILAGLLLVLFVSVCTSLSLDSLLPYLVVSSAYSCIPNSFTLLSLPITVTLVPRARVQGLCL